MLKKLKLSRLDLTLRDELSGCSFSRQLLPPFPFSCLIMFLSSQGRMPKNIWQYFGLLLNGGSGGSATVVKKSNCFFSKYFFFFRNYSEPVQDPQYMIYTWSGVFLAYLQLLRQLWKCPKGSEPGQKNDGIKEEEEEFQVGTKCEICFTQFHTF